jgi:phosphoserine phosphatase
MSPTNGIKLLLLDMDGTLTTVKSPWQFVHEQIGTWEKVGKALLARFLANEITYQQFCEGDAKAYREAGFSLDQIVDVINTIPIPPATLEFLEYAINVDARPVIISTGFTFTAERFLNALNLHPKAVDIIANSLVEQDGLVVPRLSVVDGDPACGKGAWARKMIAQHNVPREAVGAVGDSEADRPMFEAAGQFFKVRGPQDLLNIPWFKVE